MESRKEMSGNESQRLKKEAGDEPQMVLPHGDPGDTKAQVGLRIQLSGP